MRDAHDNFVIVDGRPFAEFHKMNIPGGICCPNGELVLRIKDIAPDPATKIVVNCAGRTRSIIGAQTLIDFGVPNPVYALQNGTQGWFLAGLELERGKDRQYADPAASADMSDLRLRARRFARARGAVFVGAREAHGWLADASRTTYFIDVRGLVEFTASAIPGFIHAPGGQLVQASDQWIGVKGARVVLLDDEGVRAPVIAGWMRQLGHEALVLRGGRAAAEAFDWRRPTVAPNLPEVTPLLVNVVENGFRSETVQIVDLRPSMAYRKGHIPHAVWALRPRIVTLALNDSQTVVLVADEASTARLAAIDLKECGATEIGVLEGGYPAWRSAGLPVEASPELPADADCIDFLFFAHDRHEGNAEAARQYLAWETGLLGQIDEQERGVFRIVGSA
jgi:rhodanese-related sulfurtransferase